MQIRTRTIQRLRDALLQSGRKPTAVISSAFETLARNGLLTDEERAALNRVDPIAEAMFLVMAADQVLMETEVSALRGAIRGLSGDTLGEGVIQVMLETFALRLKKEGRSARLEAIAAAVSGDPSERESAFTLAAATAIADDEVAAGEDVVLHELAEKLGYSEDAVLAMLNRIVDDGSRG